ncbi:helix-turn-helix domain-containing protein [Fibrella aestuarina]|uniref:helix-turn-helix domain-containing protein n=1 Tax=Fibrella aestuarina TaxID=651143 RepID=UPI00059B6920|nr:helix-turn-helix transcriptional regulator [Fibrella aestuarina]
MATHPDDIKQQVGAMIREARIRKGLTLKELGLQLGVSESVAARYEQGKQNLTIETLQKLATALGFKFEARFV